jgi:hypothetical protein
MTPAFERRKTVHNLVRAAIVIGLNLLSELIIIFLPSFITKSKSYPFTFSASESSILPQMHFTRRTASPVLKCTCIISHSHPHTLSLALSLCLTLWKIKPVSAVHWLYLQCMDVRNYLCETSLLSFGVCKAFGVHLVPANQWPWVASWKAPWTSNESIWPCCVFLQVTKLTLVARCIDPCWKKVVDFAVRRWITTCRYRHRALFWRGFTFSPHTPWNVRVSMKKNIELYSSEVNTYKFVLCSFA